jgi:hypothetical protein
MRKLAKTRRDVLRVQPKCNSKRLSAWCLVTSEALGYAVLVLQSLSDGFFAPLFLHRFWALQAGFDAK